MVAHKCICQICVCGRHRCPHKPFGKIDGPCLITEYHEQYKKKAASFAASFKPKYEPMVHGEPMQGTTTFRTDYRQHKLQQRFVKPPAEYIKPEGAIDAMTSYKKEYTLKEAQRAMPSKRNDQRKVEGTFSGEPTYTADFKRWQLPPRERHGDKHSYAGESAPFEGLPTYKSDYVPHGFAMRETLKPTENAINSDEPFDGRTGYRDDYIKFPIPPKAPKSTVEYKAPKVAMEGVTTNKADFTEKAGGRALSFKPDAGAFRSDAPFSDDTTFRRDFKRWTSERPAPFRPEEWVKPEGEIDFKTTTRMTYDEKQPQRVAAAKPEYKRPVTAQFDGTTTHKEDFRKWSLGNRAKAVSQAEYSPPEAPFEGMSTHQAHYTLKRAEMARSFKPESVAVQGGAFDDTTMYRVDFTAKKAEPCPAALLNTPMTGYVFQQEDSKGHKYYQQNIAAAPAAVLS